MYSIHRGYSRPVRASYDTFLIITEPKATDLRIPQTWYEYPLLAILH